MPLKTLLFTALGTVLQYSLLLLIYVFLFRVIKAVYIDLKAPSAARAGLGPAVSVKEARQAAKLLVSESGPLCLSQDTYELEESISIGRNDHNDIVINDGFISHEHACITRHKQRYWLVDLGSTNGTYLNGCRITEETVLSNGDKIKIGAVTFTFEG